MSPILLPQQSSASSPHLCAYMILRSPEEVGLSYIYDDSIIITIIWSTKFSPHLHQAWPHLPVGSCKPQWSRIEPPTKGGSKTLYYPTSHHCLDLRPFSAAGAPIQSLCSSKQAKAARQSGKEGEGYLTHLCVTSISKTTG